MYFDEATVERRTMDFGFGLLGFFFYYTFRNELQELGDRSKTTAFVANVNWESIEKRISMKCRIFEEIPSILMRYFFPSLGSGIIFFQGVCE